MDQNIYSRIIQPLEMALQGQIPSAPLDWGRGSVPTYAWFVRDKQGRADELFEELLPYYEEFLFNPENRMFVAYDECTDASKSWQYNATLCLRSLLDKDKERWPRLFGHHDLFDFALKCADLESKRRYSRCHFFNEYACGAVANGLESDWDALQGKVLPELTNAPKDYNKLLVDECCFLWGVILIAKATVGNPEKRSLLTVALRNQWEIFQDLYSILTGLIIKKHVSYTAVIAPYAALRKDYAHLMVSMLSHKKDIANGMPIDKRNKFFSKRKEVEAASTSIEQRHDLDELVQIVFPDVSWGYFDHPTERLTMAETLNKMKQQDMLLKEKDEQIKHWRGMAEDLTVTLNEMKQSYRENALSVEEISKLILSFDVGTDLMVYHLFDDELEDSDAWQKGRKSLLKSIKQKKEEQKKLVAGNTTINVAAGGINVQQANNVGK